MTLNPRTELLFPPHLIPDLKDLRGEVWRELVEHVAALPDMSLRLDLDHVGAGRHVDLKRAGLVGLRPDVSGFDRDDCP